MFRTKIPLLIEINSTCNVRCVWCMMQVFKKHRLGLMTLEQFKGIIKINRRYLRNFSVEPYFRGEPLIHPDFWAVCDLLKKNHIQNNGINTNLSVKVDILKFLQYDMSCILVNIGGTTKEVHERTMIGSNFELVASNLRKLWGLGVPAQVKMNPTKLNTHQLDELPKFVESLGGKREFIVPYTTCYPIPATATPKEIDYFFENVVSEEVNDYLRFTHDSGIKAKKQGCHFLGDVIFFDGQYSICCHDQLQMIDVGNVFETTIKKIRSSSKYAEAIKNAGEHSFCRECN